MMNLSVQSIIFVVDPVSISLQYLCYYFHFHIYPISKQFYISVENAEGGCITARILRLELEDGSSSLGSDFSQGIY